MEKIWEHAFTNELHIVPQEHNVMLSEIPLNTRDNREKMAQIMFETFKVPGVYIANQSVLSLYSSGKFDGTVIDSGHGVTHSVPIFDGYALYGSTLRINLAGWDLTDYLTKILSEKGYNFNTYNERNIVEDIKEKVCYVSLDFEGEIHQLKCEISKNVTYEMPDGNVITLGPRVRFLCPEVLFNPCLIGKEFAGIHLQFYDSIMRSDLDLRKNLYQNIFMSGGNTLFPGLLERFIKEVQKLAPKNIESNIQVKAYPERKYSTWIGGSIISSISTSSCMWITKDEYNDSGLQVVHRKCF